DIALFHANSNNFTGTISPNIAKLPYLYELDISNNQFSGPFPTAVVGMDGLTFLDIRFNFFDGSVPPQIFTQNLEALFINNNDFMLTLPDNIGSTHILYLTLANNKFNGPLPGGIFKALSFLTEVLFLNNRLTGCIPYEIGYLREAIVFDAGNNQLTGTLPFSLSCLEKVEQLNFAGNLLFGMVPEVVCQLERLVNLSLSDNYFIQVGASYHLVVVRLVLENLDLGGVFAQNTLTHLDQLRVLSLKNNSLTGQIPDLSGLSNLKTLFLDDNSFTGSFPPSISSLHRLRTIDFSYNNLTGPIPTWLTSLDRLLDLRLDHNRFNGSIPPLNQSSLQTFNVSCNNLTGAIPVTLTLSRFGVSSFSLNPNLCGEIRNQKEQQSRVMIASEAAATAEAAAVIQVEQEHELEEKVKRVQGMQVAKSGNLVFCPGESQLYCLDQLMRASAELLGRGSVGTTYKAVLDNRLIVCVKRLDATKLAGTSKDVFQRHMESVGGLRHPNLVPLRAYFQAKEERLLIYDYQPNGSLSSLIHGSKSTRAKPLHWTSCLKIAEDVAQGLSYIHQAWRLVHGNLKSSNVLLGPDFEACIADYCLTALTSPPLMEDNPDATAYKAPETRNANRQSTSKSDVYAFGILLLELLTGKHPSQHPFLVPKDTVQWVRSSREDDCGEDDRLIMLVEVAIACSLTSPEQRPTMWQVLKMFQEIKEAELIEEGELDPQGMGMGMS
ncbi:Pkinase domain-containing protein/LRR_1 domain-containing protein/LRR_8 domain-containing protein, partial [Cephalotus follicularis]